MPVTRFLGKMELLHHINRNMDFLRDSAQHPMPIAWAPEHANGPSEAAYGETERYTEARDALKQWASLQENLGDLNVEVEDDASSAFDGLSTIAQSGSRWSYDGSNPLRQSTSSAQVDLSERLQRIYAFHHACHTASLSDPELKTVKTLRGKLAERYNRAVDPYYTLDQNLDLRETQITEAAPTSPASAKSRVLRETRLPSTLDGREISAFPDVGAAANFIALRYVRTHGLTINSAARNLVQTAVGSAVDILGTVTLPFSFRGEKKVHQMEFNVMRDAVHDVIIGSPFLKLTKTFTRYKHRLQQMLREVRLPRLRFLGSHQYIRGRVNGSYVDAVPDTGADVPVMSLSFAEEHGFEVITDPEHRILLQFADGSTATTLGMVRNMEWSFGSSGAQHHIDVYVLEELQTGLILDNTFLYDTNAFVAHERGFWTTNGGMFGDGWMISIIKLVDRVLKGSRLTNSGKYSGLTCKLACVYSS